MRIRAVRAGELEVLRDIERAAGVWFRDAGMPEVADDEPPSLEVLAAHRSAGRAWVAVDDLDRVVAYLLTDRVDSNDHIEQVSVHPEYARHGIGRLLIEHAADRAVDDGVSALTLTTFAHVPWNAPYYLRCGFQVLDESQWTPGLAAIRRREAAHGLDRWPRVCMCRKL